MLHRWSFALFALIASLALAAPASAQPFAYVLGQQDASGAPAIVSVIDTATDGKVASITIGPDSRDVKPHSIAVASDVARVYAATTGLVSVIDMASNAVVTTIAVGAPPNALVAKPNGSRVYVLNGSAGGSISEIDTATNAVLTTIPLGVGLAAGIAITPDGARLYVSTTAPNSVKVIATDSMSVIATVPVGSSTLGLGITPDGSRAYVTAPNSNAVYAIDTTTHTVVATITVGTRPLSARVTPDGTRVFVANELSGTVSVINTQTNTVIETIPNIPKPQALAFTPAGTRAYVASETAVRIINTATNTVIGTIPFVAAVDGHPAAIAMGRAPGGNPPTAVNESHLAIRDTPLSVPSPGVLANDNPDGGGAMTTLLVSDVTQGTLALNADGGFTYTPAPGFLGTDSFTYRAVNGVGQSNLATVTLSVVKAPPPAGLYASRISGNTVTLRWTPPAAGPAPTEYLLEGGVFPGEVLASIPTGSTAPIFTVDAPTGTFYVRVHAFVGGEWSAASNEIRIVVNMPEAPSAPANLLGVVNGSDVSLAWRNTFEGGAPTALHLDVSGSFGGRLPLPLADTVSFAGVPPGTYTLGVRAENASGLSNSSNLITLTFPGPCSGPPLTPTNFVAARDGNLITVLWERATSGPAATDFVLTVTGGFVGAFATTERSLSGSVGPGSYTISVYARNSCGDSSPTASQTVIVP